MLLGLILSHFVFLAAIGLFNQAWLPQMRDAGASGGLGPVGFLAMLALYVIRVSTDLDDAADAQLVLEAVPADRAVQDEVYGRLDAICAPPTSSSDACPNRKRQRRKR